MVIVSSSANLFLTDKPPNTPDLNFA